MPPRARLPALLASFLPPKNHSIGVEQPFPRQLAVGGLPGVAADELDDQFLVRRLDFGKKRGIGGFRTKGVDVFEFDTVWPRIGRCAVIFEFLGYGKNRGGVC